MTSVPVDLLLLGIIALGIQTIALWALVQTGRKTNRH